MDEAPEEGLKKRKQIIFLNKKNNEGFLLHLHIFFHKLSCCEVFDQFFIIRRVSQLKNLEIDPRWRQVWPRLCIQLILQDHLSSARSAPILSTSDKRQLEIYVALSASIWNIECPTMQWISRSNRVFRGLKYKRFVGLTSSFRSWLLFSRRRRSGGVTGAIVIAKMIKNPWSDHYHHQFASWEASRGLFHAGVGFG